MRHHPVVGEEEADRRWRALEVEVVGRRMMAAVEVEGVGRPCRVLGLVAEGCPCWALVVAAVGLLMMGEVERHVCWKEARVVVKRETVEVVVRRYRDRVLWVVKLEVQR